MSIITTINAAQVPALRSPLGGGFFMGLFGLQGKTFALVRAPKAQGFHAETRWGEAGIVIPGAASCVDGLANTRAMAEAGYALGAWALGLSIDGSEDWYLGARDEIELVYRACKPTAEENWCSFRDGDNPSSLPPGYLYTPSEPAQSPDAAFQEGGEEALEACGYWSSTQGGPFLAWVQAFVGGLQTTCHKGYARPAFAVRRIEVTP
ncbi:MULTISPECIES: DUF1566 domain-containing protein [unclassified Pseudomonas]|uniref:DUF1566 domain-containing protein n=1 Tax=unclassified Pseudomonas TaxID=196821 RepID=UPI002448E341|nr:MULTISPECIES: DUF1566 domain-containing protein [unclassified Pseudomonas]MDG9928499.1 DUF1566 domain-containing protein [Pseudomonas sp. GD04042]MDH0482669.1 DUF1566 domain-containing protein [Pseudomonas sp. GD04015]MDH0604629.1 DUF1566 domain-containing protein [Pseudomonas sp. GD03869]